MFVYLTAFNVAAHYQLVHSPLLTHVFFLLITPPCLCKPPWMLTALEYYSTSAFVSSSANRSIGQYISHLGTRRLSKQLQCTPWHYKTFITKKVPYHKSHHTCSLPLTASTLLFLDLHKKTKKHLFFNQKVSSIGISFVAYLLMSFR